MRIRKKQTLYKYRNIKSFEFFCDILINSRLYAAEYSKLNDPMEGIYRTDGTLSKEIIDIIKDEKQQIKICSLSTRPDDSLMWVHYADEARGVLLELVVSDPEITLEPVVYNGTPRIEGSSVTATEILKNKLKAWEYEGEVRIFTSNQYVKVIIKKIITGVRMTTEAHELLYQVIKKINKKIEVLTYKEWRKRLE